MRLRDAFWRVTPLLSLNAVCDGWGSCVVRKREWVWDVCVISHDAGHHMNGRDVIAVYLRRSMDKSKIPYDSLHGLTLIALMRV
jgi:hypothetical protein